MSLGSVAEPERFRSWIAQRMGLYFDDCRLDFLAEVLARRAEARREHPGRYLDTLQSVRAGDEVRTLALELTVPETYFFRHMEQFRAFAEIALPARMQARAESRRLRLLCAGCASGEEPYSLAILLREQMAEVGWNVSLRAVDINSAMLEKAARGRYSSWALRETPPELQRRWFRQEGREAILDDGIRSAVAFQERNLAQEDPELWAPEAYDIVFCRNLLMYFAMEQAQALVARLTRALAPGGYLFLGHAETLRGLSSDFHLCHSHDTFYYQRKERAGSKPASPAARPGFEGETLLPADRLPMANPAMPASGEAAEEPAWAATWLGTVQRASERIQALARRTPAAPRSGTANEAGPRAATATSLQLALELLSAERFSEALDLLAQLPAESARDPEAILLRAALLTHSGRREPAEKACAELLERDELNTGGHYLLALCRESAGDRQAAVDHDQVAIYLDPSFAMPRLHLGLMARRSGDRETAQRELGHALLLLHREDASRLLLFSGGFGREALIALCRAELVGAGGHP